MKLYINDVNKLYEQDVEIEVKHEGILEVPEGKNVDDLPMSHFEKLAKKKGLGKITKALNNLQVWNKKKDPKLSKWAGDMIDKLNKKLKKDEAVKRSYYGTSPESKRKELADRFGKTFMPDDHMLVCKDGKVLNIQIGKKYRCTAFDGQRVEIVDIVDTDDKFNGAALVAVGYRGGIYSVSSEQLYESARNTTRLQRESYDIPTGWKERTISVDDDEQEAAVEEILAYAKRDNDRIEWDIDYNGGAFADSRVFYIYSDGDTFEKIRYKVREMKDDSIYGRGAYESYHKKSLKTESATKSYWSYNIMDPNTERDDEYDDPYFDEYSIRKIRLTPCQTPEECWSNNNAAVTTYDWPHDEFFGTKEEAYDMLLKVFNISIYERIHDL